MTTQISLLNRNYANSELKPYQIDTTDGSVIYERWESGIGSLVIRRTTIDGSLITCEVASGTWADRATLTYQPLYF